MATTHHMMTAEELLALPDDGYRYELVRGELRRMAPAGHEHGRLAMNIGIPLGQHVRAHDVGVVYAAETGFVLARDPDCVRAPDVAFVRKERAEAVRDERGFWPGAPDLAVEVISPSDLYTEVEEEVWDWIDAGTRMVIVVNPRTRTVTVVRSRAGVKILTEQDTLDGGDVVPGWILPVREIFT
jgi:Uma2 family endonuclease